MARHYVSYQWALLAGIVGGSTISFLMSKLFAFSIARLGVGLRAKPGRFLVVYGAGVALYWCVSFVAGHLVLPRLMPERVAEIVGVLIGAGAMMVTGYFGHRFYTYARVAELG